MPGRYGFVSTGANVSNAILQELMRREQEKQQRILEEAAAQERDENRRFRERELALREQDATDRRAALATARDEKVALTRASAYDIGEIVSPDDVAAIQRSVPGILHKQTTLPGRTLDMPTDPLNASASSKVPGIVMPVQPTGEMTYRGLPEQREAQQARDRRAAYMNDPKVPDAARRFLQAQDATGDTSLPYQMFAPPTAARVTFSQPQTRIVDGRRTDVRAGSDGFWYAMNGTRIDDPRRVKPEPDRVPVDSRTRDNPLLPRGVETYLGRLKREGRSRDQAQQEVYGAWDQLVRDHPNLSPTSVEQAFGRLWPDDLYGGGSGGSSGAGGGADDQLSVPPDGEDTDTGSVFDDGDDEPRAATSADVARVAQAMGISHSDARRRLEAQGVAVVD